MKKTAFLCFGVDGGEKDLFYQELPRKDSGEEFFLFFSHGDPTQEALLKTLFRKSISASRFGHPIHYFLKFVEQFKELISVEKSAEELLTDAILVIMIRRGNKVHLFNNRNIETLHWNGINGVEGTFESLAGVREIYLGKGEEQGDLFEHSIEDQFVLRYFTVPTGNHTLVFVPSKEFAGRNREILRNSIFFPSFEVPTEKSIDLAVSRTFPAIHWNISDSSVREKKATTSKPGLKRISIPAAVGILTALIAIILVFRPFNRGKPVHLSTEPFALLTAGDNESAGKLHREEGGTVEPTGDGKRSVSLVESWKKSFRQPVTSSPVFYKGTIFFGCRDSTMYAFTKDGRLKWKHFSGNGIGASPCCVSGRVIGANYSGDVFCLDDEDGSEVWSFNAKAKIVSTPRAWKNLVLIGTMDGNLIALDLEDGKRLWSEKIGSAIWASVSIGDECIIAATTDCSLIKLDQGGKIIWRVKPGGGILSSPLCLETKNLIVFGTKDRYIYAYSLEKGNLMWRYATEGEMNGPPASDGKYIFAGSEDGKLYTLTLNGRLVWESDLGGSVLSRPLIIGETVFVTTYSNKLSGLKKDTGEIVGEYRTGSPIYSSPSHDGERIFFGSNGGIFYAVRLYNEDSE